MFKEFSLGCLVVASSPYLKKKAEMVTRCHSLSFVVTRHSLYHSLPFVVTRCNTRCHSLSLDVPLVSLFINDLDKKYLDRKSLNEGKIVFCKKEAIHQREHK